MIEQKKGKACIMCESTKNLTEIKVDETDSVYVCEDCSEKGEAYINRFDPTPF